MPVDRQDLDGGSSKREHSEAQRHRMMDMEGRDNNPDSTGCCEPALVLLEMIPFMILLALGVWLLVENASFAGQYFIPASVLSAIAFYGLYMLCLRVVFIKYRRGERVWLKGRPHIVQYIGLSFTILEDIQWFYIIENVPSMCSGPPKSRYLHSAFYSFTVARLGCHLLFDAVCTLGMLSSTAGVILYHAFAPRGSGLHLAFGGLSGVFLCYLAILIQAYIRFAWMSHGAYFHLNHGRNRCYQVKRRGFQYLCYTDIDTGRRHWKPSLHVYSLNPWPAD